MIPDATMAAAGLFWPVLGILSDDASLRPVERENKRIYDGSALSNSRDDERFVIVSNRTRGVNCLGAFGICWTIQPLHNSLTTVYCRLEDPGNA